LELLSRRAPGLGKEKGGAVGSGRGRKGVEKLWPAGGGLDGGAPHDRDGGLVTCARTASSGFYSPGEQARLQASTAKGYPGLQCHGTVNGVGLRERSGPATDRRTTQVAITTRYGEGTVRHASLGGRREGDRRLWPRGGGNRAHTDAKAGAALCGGALERGRAVFQPVNPLLTAILSKKLNCATKMVDTKVVDETSLYNICKGCPMFFSTV
jgi:hypothetical protein